MQIGDLVLVHPAKGRPCVIVSLTAEPVAGAYMDNCVTIWVPDYNTTIPMNKKWIEVISESR